MKKITAGIMTLMLSIAMCSCAAPADNADTAGSTAQPAESTAKEEITILAAASLTDVCGELESIYNSTH